MNTIQHFFNEGGWLGNRVNSRRDQPTAAAPALDLPVGQERADWYRISEPRAQGDSTTADVYVYGVVGGSWFGSGVVAEEFVREINDLDVDVLNVFVHSPGGNVYEGIAILNGLRRHKARVVVTIDGLAASAASFIAMAGDEIVAGRNSQLMIHDAWVWTVGNAAELTEQAEYLDKLSNNIASIYAERSGKGGREEWRSAMLAETWYDPDEALAAGLVDRVAGADDDADDEQDAAAGFDLSVFAHAGRAGAPDPWIPSSSSRRGAPLRLDAAAALPTAVRAMRSVHLHHSPSKPPAEPVEPITPTPTEGSEMSDALMQGLRQRLGIAPDADLDDDGALAALDEALSEAAEPTTTTELPDGVVAVDAEQYAQMQADAAAGREARDAQLAEDRRRTVDAAVADGRIPPSRREHWLAQLEADPGAGQVLASLKPGTVPVTAAGYTGGVDEASDEDVLYQKAWGSQADDTEKEA